MTPSPNQLDHVLALDTTGSMSSLLESAKQQFQQIMAELRQQTHIDSQTAIVEFRDHPPQENSYVTKVHPFSSNQQTTQRVLNGLKAQGGGDAPEAVYDGVYAAIEQLEWRPHSLRLITLIGDAIPHGYRNPNRKSRGSDVVDFDNLICHKDCGLTLHKVTAAAEAKKITVNAIAISDDEETFDAFNRIALATGGICDRSNASNAMAAIGKAIQTQFSQLEVDRQALELMATSSIDVGELAAQLKVNRLTATKSLSRLAKRNLLPVST